MARNEISQKSSGGKSSCELENEAISFPQCKEILEALKRASDPERTAGMARYGINTERAFGVSMPWLRQTAKKLGKNHNLALELWASGIHEARILACLVEDPSLVSEEQADLWVRDFNSWDLCDQCCINLFRKTAFAYSKCLEWSLREEEFVKRAGFTLMATLAVHEKKASDNTFEQFLPLIVRESEDSRNYVKKAVNWALRQIGKRNQTLNGKAIETANELRASNSKTARWIASDALKELESEGVRKKLGI